MIIVANWKMYQSYTQTQKWLAEFEQALTQTGKGYNLIICPESPMLHLCAHKSFQLGAQDCASHLEGPYTGQTSARTLAELGATTCFVGHSEQRALYPHTPEILVQKILCLATYNITPLLCIADKAEDELHKICSLLAHHRYQKKLLIAYEPLWAIGTGITPTHEQIKSILTIIKKIVLTHLPNITPQILYGGSINEHNYTSFLQCSELNGLLIGKASLSGSFLCAILQALPTTREIC